jgi:hypothetical protein
VTGVASLNPTQVADVIELQLVLARYAVGMTHDDVDAVIDVFTPEGTFGAFGETDTLKDLPALSAAAPEGLFLTGTPVLRLDRDQGTGTSSGYQTLCFVDQRRPLPDGSDAASG